jgi:hypothetical protein
MPVWTFLSNHALVLLCAARDPNTRLRDIAHFVGITERATQRLLGDLVEDGYLIRVRRGRRNVYEVDVELPLRHPLEQHCSVGDVLALMGTTRACTRYLAAA